MTINFNWSKENLARSGTSVVHMKLEPIEFVRMGELGSDSKA